MLVGGKGKPPGRTTLQKLCAHVVRALADSSNSDYRMLGMQEFSSQINQNQRKAPGKPLSLTNHLLLHPGVWLVEEKLRSTNGIKAGENEKHESDNHHTIDASIN